MPYVKSKKGGEQEHMLERGSFQAFVNFMELPMLHASIRIVSCLAAVRRSLPHERPVPDLSFPVVESLSLQKFQIPDGVL